MAECSSLWDRSTISLGMDVLRVSSELCGNPAVCQHAGMTGAGGLDQDLLELVDVLVVNRVEAEAMAGRPVPNRAATAAASGVCPLSAALTSCSRPMGVNHAFLCMFIRSSSMKLQCHNQSFLDPDRMDNLLRDHI